MSLKAALCWGVGWMGMAVGQALLFSFRWGQMLCGGCSRWSKWQPVG